MHRDITRFFRRLFPVRVTRIKPGDDFYEYANGERLRSARAALGSGAATDVHALRSRTYWRIGRILQNCVVRVKNGQAMDGSAQSLVGQFCISAMDETQIDSAGAEPLKPLLDAIAGLNDQKDLGRVLALLHECRVEALFLIEPEPDAADSTRCVAQIRYHGRSLPLHDHYLSDDESCQRVRSEFVEHVANIFKLLGISEEESLERAKGVLGFETDLAKIYYSVRLLPEQRFNFQKSTIQDLNEITTGFNWPGYFEALGVSTQQLGQIGVQRTEIIREVLNLVMNTPIGIFKDYLRWRLVYSVAPYLSDPFVRENFRFYHRPIKARKAEISTRDLRWMNVVQSGDAALGEAIGKVYVDATFALETKDQVQNFVHELKEAFKELVSGLGWMSPRTRRAALAKIDHIDVQIGYPDRWRDYSGLQIALNQPHVLNVFAVHRFETLRRLAKIGQPVDRGEWIACSPQRVNTMYTPQLNQLTIPAGILQQSFFDPGADDAVNYSRIGVWIAHEMASAFDPRGRQYDSRGNLRNWWEPQDERQYNERRSKVVRQLAKDGQLTGNPSRINEAIADIGSLEIAYHAFQRVLARKPASERRRKIGGVTPEQRFFISYAQSRRGNEIPERALRTDLHSPEKYRVNGVLSNMPEFAAAFGIAQGSRMLRSDDERVQFWSSSEMTTGNARSESQNPPIQRSVKLGANVRSKLRKLKH